MLHKLANVYREYGLVLGLLYGLDRTLERLSSRMRLYVYQIMLQPIPDKPLLPERFAKRLVLREIKPGDPELGRIRTHHQVNLRFAQRAVCLGVFRNEAFLGYLWFCHEAYEEDEVRCTYFVLPREQAVFDFDLYIFPEYRMGLAFASIWHSANEYFRARGVRATYSRLAQLNVQSRRAHDKLGWRPIGRAVFLRIGPVEIMAATLWPYLHVSCSRSSRAQLRLSSSSI
jgi:hypothetical protein